MKYKIQITKIKYETVEYMTNAESWDEAIDKGVETANERFGDEWLDVHAIRQD